MPVALKAVILMLRSRLPTRIVAMTENRGSNKRSRPSPTDDEGARPKTNHLVRRRARTAYDGIFASVSTKRTRSENADACGTKKRSRPSPTDDEGVRPKTSHPARKLIHDAVDKIIT